MRQLAYLLITVAFLAASYVAVLDERSVQWPLMIGALVPGVVGLVLVRVARAREAGDLEKRSASLDKLTIALDEIVDRTDALWDQRDSVFAYDFKDRVDADLARRSRSSSTLGRR